MTYSPDKEGKGIFIQIPVERVKEIIAMNRKGVIPPKAVEHGVDAPVAIKYTDGGGEERLSRFDEKKKKKKKNKNRNKSNSNNNNNGNNNPAKSNNNTPKNENNQNNGANNRQGQRPKQKNQNKPENKPKQEQNPQPNTEQ